jgi:spoIIIJ-associated protein
MEGAGPGKFPARQETTMEWVETTGKSLDQAKDLALDQLGVGADDAEFEVLEEPRTGLFGRVRGEARVRARVRPAAVRPKQDRRTRRRSEAKGAERGSGRAPERGDEGASAPASDADSTPSEAPAPAARKPRERGGRSRRGGWSGSAGGGGASASTEQFGSAQGDTMSNDDNGSAFGDQAPRDAVVEVAEVREAAEKFADGLVEAFGLTGSTSATVDGNEIEVRIEAEGDGLGLLIGPGGRTLLAIQDLARVAAQRRLGDHDTRLRIDVAGYREKRRIALERFARNVAELVKESGIARSLDPMPSADRKVIHDTLTEIEGVVSRSEGEDPNRRIIVSPA